MMRDDNALHTCILPCHQLDKLAFEQRIFGCALQRYWGSRRDFGKALFGQVFLSKVFLSQVFLSKALLSNVSGNVCKLLENVCVVVRSNTGRRYS